MSTKAQRRTWICYKIECFLNELSAEISHGHFGGDLIQTEADRRKLLKEMNDIAEAVGSENVAFKINVAREA